MNDDLILPGRIPGRVQHGLIPGTLVAGRFLIESLLGIGGMGAVYRATDQTLNVQVALKLLRAKLVSPSEEFDRFREELLLSRQVSSPHVVRIHDFVQHKKHWLISMDYIEGEPLEARLARDGRLAVDDALKIAQQVAEGLRNAHAKGVVHRDLKPGNLLIDGKGDVYICDFGVAASLRQSGMTERYKIVGWGTLEYLPPEDICDKPGEDPRSDLYMLGLVLYEMLVGRKPFGGSEDYRRSLAARLLSAPPSVRQDRPEVPLWVAQLVDRLLQPQPEHRLQSAAAVVTAFKRRRVPAVPWALQLQRLQPKRLAWIGIGAAAMLVLAVGGIAWWQFVEHQSAVVVAPLQRLLVLPITGDAKLEDRFAGLSAHLRDALATRIAVVDGERSEQVLRRLNPPVWASPDPAPLRAAATANRVLQPRLITEKDGRWRLQAELHTGASKPQHFDGVAAADPVTALRAGLPALAVALGLRQTDLNLALPAHTAALDAYGAALRRQWRRGPGQETVAMLRRVTEAEPGYAAAWLALAEAAHIAGEDQIAADAATRGQRVAATAPQPLQARFKALRALLDGDAPTAIAEWRALSKVMPDDGFAALNLARAQTAGGDLNAATAGLRTLVARDKNDPRAWYELGKLAILQGDARRALDEYLPQALKLYQGSRDDYGEAETLNALGVSYDRLGLTADAEKQYRRALELRRQVGNHRGVALSLYNLATLAGLHGRFEQAARSLDEAHALYARLGDRKGLAATENQIGHLARQRGDYHSALAAYRHALTARQQIGDVYGEATTLNNIGYAHYQLGDYANAQVLWQQAAQAYGKFGDASGSVRIEQNLGLLEIARGQWAEARQRLTRSLPAAEKGQMLQEVAVTRLNLAELEFWQGHLRTAFEQMDQAEALFRQHENQINLVELGRLRVQTLLAVHADTSAQRALDALTQVLNEASNEHRAIAALLRAELAQRQGDAGRAADALAEARRLANAGGIRQLQLQADLLSARAQPGDLAKLDADTAAIGHAGLRLAFLELALSQALAAGDGAAAASRYGQAQRLLRGGDYLRAAQLHALGAKALAATADTVGAEEARRMARAALVTLRAQIPEAMRAGFDAAPDSARAIQMAQRKRPEQAADDTAVQQRR